MEPIEVISKTLFYLVKSRNGLWDSNFQAENKLTNLYQWQKKGKYSFAYDQAETWVTSQSFAHSKLLYYVYKQDFQGVILYWLFVLDKHGVAGIRRIHTCGVMPTKPEPRFDFDSGYWKFQRDPSLDLTSAHSYDVWGMETAKEILIKSQIERIEAFPDYESSPALLAFMRQLTIKRIPLQPHQLKTLEKYESKVIENEDGEIVAVQKEVPKPKKVKPKKPGEASELKIPLHPRPVLIIPDVRRKPMLM